MVVSSSSCLRESAMASTSNDDEDCVFTEKIIFISKSEVRPYTASYTYTSKQSYFAPAVEQRLNGETKNEPVRPIPLNRQTRVDFVGGPQIALLSSDQGIQWSDYKGFLSDQVRSNVEEKYPFETHQFLIKYTLPLTIAFCDLKVFAVVGRPEIFSALVGVVQQAVLNQLWLPKCPFAVVIAPEKKLHEVYDIVDNLAYQTNVKVFCVSDVHAVEFKRCSDEMFHVDVLITTPAVFPALFATKPYNHLHIKTLTYLVYVHAECMFETKAGKFDRVMEKVVEKIRSDGKDVCQIMLCSPLRAIEPRTFKDDTLTMFIDPAVAVEHIVFVAQSALQKLKELERILRSKTRTKRHSNLARTGIVFTKDRRTSRFVKDYLAQKGLAESRIVEEDPTAFTQVKDGHLRFLISSEPFSDRASYSTNVYCFVFYDVPDRMDLFENKHGRAIPGRKCYLLLDRKRDITVNKLVPLAFYLHDNKQELPYFLEQARQRFSMFMERTGESCLENFQFRRNGRFNSSSTF